MSAKATPVIAALQKITSHDLSNQLPSDDMKTAKKLLHKLITFKTGAESFISGAHHIRWCFVLCGLVVLGGFHSCLVFVFGGWWVVLGGVHSWLGW